MRLLTTIFFIVAVAISVTVPSSATRANSASFKAGIASRVITPDVPMWMAGYGPKDVQLGPRGVGRQDLLVALAPARQPAVLRGQATTEEQTPVWSGRVAVREGATTVIADNGTFTISNVTPGTQWVSVQAIGRGPSGQAVDLRPGDTTWLSVTLGPLPVTLAPVRVLGQASRMLADFEERPGEVMAQQRVERSQLLGGFEHLLGGFGMPAVEE